MNKEELKEKAKQKWEEAKKLPGKAINKTVEFYNENKEFCMAVAVPVAFGIGKAVLKAASGSRSRQDDTDYKSRSVWDPRSGQWFQTRKPMSNYQKKEFARRKSEGEDVYEILDDMNLI